MDKIFMKNKKHRHHHHNPQQHEKHVHQGPRHRPLDPFELYALEHMSPNMRNNVPSEGSGGGRGRHHPKPDQGFATGDYYYRTETTNKAHNQQYPAPPAEEEEMYGVDAAADEFIAYKHQKFELSKWMPSLKDY